MANTDDPVVTDADVAAAEAAAQEAQELITQLEEAVANGDESVTPEQIVAQESLGRFARLRAEAARRKAAKSKEAARLRDCETLHSEIEGYADTSGQHFSDLLQAVHDAREAFKEAVGEHNERVHEWTQRARVLDVAVHDGRPVPPASDARLALGRGADLLRSGTRTFYTVDSEQYLQSLEGSDAAAAIENLKTIDAPSAESTATHFYRGENGAIISRDRPYTPEELTYVKVQQITKKEAWGE